MTVVVEFNIIPLGRGINVSKYLVPALKEVKKIKMNCQITPMCTIFEAKNVEEAFNIVKAAHGAVFKTGVKRVVTTVKIDDRRDLDKSMEDKVQSLTNKMG